MKNDLEDLRNKLGLSQRSAATLYWEETGDLLSQASISLYESCRTRPYPEYVRWLRNKAKEVAIAALPACPDCGAQHIGRCRNNTMPLVLRKRKGPAETRVEKHRSVRVYEDTYTRMRIIKEEAGLSWGEIFERMLSTWEKQSAAQSTNSFSLVRRRASRSAAKAR